MAYSQRIAAFVRARIANNWWKQQQDPWLWEVSTDGMMDEEKSILKGMQFEGHGVQPPAILKEGVVMAVTHDLSTDSLFSNSTTKESDDYVDGSDERTQIPWWSISEERCSS
mgnify:CR=1 FL=1